MAEGYELPRGVRGHAPPEIFLNAGICAEMQSGAF